MMWTSHDTVGFVFLAGFCVQFGFSFEDTYVVFGEMRSVFPQFALPLLGKHGVVGFKAALLLELSAVLKAPLGPTLKQLKAAQSAHSGVSTHWEINGASRGEREF
ncbi:hypothetical protein CCH79_00015419 [Gambusia affinis]|uniref:Uncharacterized protein n=1 Tax=Gambusia affinis TaxID=33528 RepID=A0A315VGU9_GAMAF|nr:hypothetical protein CCH79_00015419 [Gambusia affinis]